MFSYHSFLDCDTVPKFGVLVFQGIVAASSKTTQRNAVSEQKPASFRQWHENYWICHVFLIEVRGSFETSTWIKSKYSYSSSTIIQYWRKTIYFSSLFKRTNGVMIAVRDINIPFTRVSYLNTKNFHSAIFITVQGFPLLLINWTMKMNLKLSFQKKRRFSFRALLFFFFFTIPLKA